MRDTDVWFVLNVGRIGCSDCGFYEHEVHHSRKSVLTSLGGIDDLSSLGEELHRLLDKAIDYISRAQEK